ncbi:hypothetical protein DSECCO2_570950 [anaerobic digester metagenome]
MERYIADVLAGVYVTDVSIPDSRVNLEGRIAFNRLNKAPYPPDDLIPCKYKVPLLGYTTGLLTL